MAPPKGSTNSRNSAPAVLAALPGTRAQIELRTGYTNHAVFERLKKLRAAGLAHIGGWERVPEGTKGAQWLPVYHAGPGPDAPCRFRKKSARQLAEAYAARTRLTGERDLILAKKRARYWKMKAARQRDPLVAALFGPPPKHP